MNEQLEKLKQEFDKNLNFTGKKLVFNGFIAIVVGLLLIWKGTEGSRQLIDWVATYFFFAGIWNLLIRFFKKKEDRDSIWTSVVQIVLAAVIGTLNELTLAPVTLIVRVFGLYQLFMGSIYLITWYLYRKDRIPKRGKYLFDALVYVSLGLSAVTDAVGDAELQYFMFGVYVFFLGTTYLRDGLFFASDAGMANLKRHGRVNLPIVLVALIPNGTLRKINQVLHAEEEHQDFKASDIYNDAKVSNTPDLEVFIHVTESGFGAMGHVDICYQNKVISFGSYDTFSEKLGGAIGDGVLFKVDREKYIDFCKVESNKTLFGYGLLLNDAQRQAVEKRIAEIESQVYVWQPSNEPIKKDDPNSLPMYSYRLQQETGAELFKFKEGKFKSYFVLSTNCVLLADSIIGQAGTDVLSVRGVISPGTYQDYLDKEYAKPHSIVVTRSVY